jgi:hypothetical protein
VFDPSITTNVKSLGGGKVSCDAESITCGSPYRGIIMHKVNGRGGSCEEQCSYFVDLRKQMGWKCGPCP